MRTNAVLSANGVVDPLAVGGDTRHDRRVLDVTGRHEPRHDGRLLQCTVVRVAQQWRARVSLHERRSCSTKCFWKEWRVGGSAENGFREPETRGQKIWMKLHEEVLFVVEFQEFCFA